MDGPWNYWNLNILMNKLKYIKCISRACKNCLDDLFPW